MMQMNYSECVTVDIVVDREKPDTAIKEILKIIRPKWNPDNVLIKTQSESFRYTAFSCHEASDTEYLDWLVVKAEKTDMHELIPKDKNREIANWNLINRKKVGMPLYAKFNNGMVFKFLTGATLTYDEMKKPHIAKLAAMQFALLHHASIGEKICRDKHITEPDDLHWLDALARKSFTELAEMKKKPEHKEIFDKLEPIEKMEKEFHQIKAYLKSLNMETVLCHNDGWRENFLYDNDKDTLMLIDYEALEENYCAYDLGTYLVACADNPPRIEEMVSEAFCKDFIREYLENRHSLSDKPLSMVTQEMVDTYYKHACLCMAARAYHMTMCLFHIFLGGNMPITDDGIPMGFYRFYIGARNLYWTDILNKN